MDIQNALCKATVTHSESHMMRAQWVCFDAENSAIVATVKGFMYLQYSNNVSPVFKQINKFTDFRSE